MRERARKRKREREMGERDLSRESAKRASRKTREIRQTRARLVSSEGIPRVYVAFRTAKSGNFNLRRTKVVETAKGNSGVAARHLQFLNLRKHSSACIPRNPLKLNITARDWRAAALYLPGSRFYFGVGAIKPMAAAIDIQFPAQIRTYRGHRWISYLLLRVYLYADQSKESFDTMILERRTRRLNYYV